MCAVPSAPCDQVCTNHQDADGVWIDLLPIARSKAIELRKII